MRHHAEITMCNAHKNWRHTATKEYVRTNRHLENRWSKVTEEQWNQFIASRGTDEFKAKSQANKELHT